MLLIHCFEYTTTSLVSLHIWVVHSRSLRVAYRKGIGFGISVGRSLSQGHNLSAFTCTLTTLERCAICCSRHIVIDISSVCSPWSIKSINPVVDELS